MKTKPTKRRGPEKAAPGKRNYVNGRARSVKPVSFRVSAEERARLEALAASAGMRVGEYARGRVLS